jgi:hypothetical protein
MDKDFLDSKTETSGCTLEEYKYVYPRLIEDYTQQYIDYDELTFIDRELDTHSIILKSSKKNMKTISDFDFRREHFDPIEKNCGQEKFLETMSYFEKRVASHKAIISWLETRKLELEKELSSLSQQVEPKIIEQNYFSKPCFEINKFDHVNKDKVLGYFKAELVDKNYLSLETLHKYLIVAFQEKTTVAEKITLQGKFTQGNIRNIFYRYYDEIAQDKHGLKRDYCKLLGEYFVGFDTEKIIRNFNK